MSINQVGGDHEQDQALLQSRQEQADYPQTIKHYIIGKTIGQGTFNKVKIARHSLTNQKVAIKMINKQSIQNQADRIRLNTQLKILRKVRHPNIIQLYQIFQNNKYLFLVTEYASRGELFQHIVGQQKLTQFQACKFLQQLLDAIQYIHSLGVVHRDLKPQNLLLDFKFNIKLIDFGLSSIYSQGDKLKTACGSPCYASPQMIKGQPYDGLKTDIWSIGIILYAMCFGYLPFDNPNTSDLYKQITLGQYQIPDHASKQLRSLLSKVLEVDPQKRASINQIRYHPFCKFSPIGLMPGITVGLSDIPYEEEIQKQMLEQFQFKFTQRLQPKKLKQWIKFNKHNDQTSTYYLILQRNLRVKNQTVVNYYVKKNNLINRYAIAERVKINYDKRLKQRLEKMKELKIQKELQKQRIKEKKQSKSKGKQKNEQLQSSESKVKSNKKPKTMNFSKRSSHNKVKLYEDNYSPQTYPNDVFDNSPSSKKKKVNRAKSTQKKSKRQNRGFSSIQKKRHQKNNKLLTKKNQRKLFQDLIKN